MLEIDETKDILLNIIENMPYRRIDLGGGFILEIKPDYKKDSENNSDSYTLHQIVTVYDNTPKNDAVLSLAKDMQFMKRHNVVLEYTESRSYEKGYNISLARREMMIDAVKNVVKNELPKLINKRISQLQQRIADLEKITDDQWEIDL